MLTLLNVTTARRRWALGGHQRSGVPFLWKRGKAEDKAELLFSCSGGYHGCTTAWARSIAGLGAWLTSHGAGNPINSWVK